MSRKHCVRTFLQYHHPVHEPSRSGGTVLIPFDKTIDKATHMVISSNGPRRSSCIITTATESDLPAVYTEDGSARYLVC